MEVVEGLPYELFTFHSSYTNNASSSLLPVHSGVPQGNIVGPLLFLIEVNDIPQAITHSSVFLFADNAKLVKSITSFSDRPLFTPTRPGLTAYMVSVVEAKTQCI